MTVRYDGPPPHAAASPSSAGMWMNCPASITKAAGRTRPSSKYAREGTAAHKVAQMVIEGDIFPPERLVVEGQEFIIGADMLRHLNGYIGFVQQFIDDGDLVYVEQRVEVVPGLVWGTADMIAITKRVLHIADLKYGAGVAVDPDSPQLRIYALGGLMLVHGIPDAIVLSIFQPRLDAHPKIVVLDPLELKRWGDFTLRPAADRILAGDTTEEAGPWCRWCVRTNECAAFARNRASQAAVIFDDGG